MRGAVAGDCLNPQIAQMATDFLLQVADRLSLDFYPRRLDGRGEGNDEQATGGGDAVDCLAVRARGPATDVSRVRADGG